MQQIKLWKNDSSPQMTFEEQIMNLLQQCSSKGSPHSNKRYGESLEEIYHILIILEQNLHLMNEQNYFLYQNAIAIYRSLVKKYGSFYPSSAKSLLLIRQYYTGFDIATKEHMCSEDTIHRSREVVKKIENTPLYQKRNNK